MPTRLYLSTVGVPAVSPAFDAGWERTADAVRRHCYVAKTGTAMGTVTTQEPPSDENDALSIQVITPGLAGSGTLAGTVKGQMRVQEVDAASNARAQLIVRVVSANGSTFRGTALAPDMSSSITNEFATALTNRKFPKGWTGSGQALTSVAWQPGDRIVIEVGVHVNSPPAGSDEYHFRFGDTGATDLPEDETTTTDDVPWIEFSQTLVFVTAATISGTGVLTTTGIAGPDHAFQVAIDF